jgi:thiol:disulfide interchange protein DsbC
MEPREERRTRNAWLRGLRIRVLKAACNALGAASVLCSACLSGPATAQTPADPAVQAIRIKLGQRLSGLPKIDEISASGMPGLYEVRLGTDLFYTDAQSNYLIRGELIDTRSQRNLTRERIEQLTAIEFDKLPLQDAIVWKVGNGKRRIAVFADPNCPYCKKLELELQGLKDVSVYTFLYPILAADSSAKSEAIWCTKDATTAWRDWMLKGSAPQVAPTCTNPIERNLKLGRTHRIQGVPAVFFEDGTRSPGLLSAVQIEAKWARKSTP